jgi:predicted phosphoribosyltransferase
MHLFLQPSTRYRDRHEAGQALARRLCETCELDDALVLALPRGGVPVGREVADALDAPLDVFVVRKLGMPGQPELALGAIASGGIRLLDDVLIQHEGLSPGTIEDLTAAELAELERREAVYREGRPLPELAGKRVVLVDDGVATGYTMRVAVLALRRLQPARIVVAVPVGAPETCVALAVSADEVVCPLQPVPFHAVGVWYDHFPQLTDDQVRETLAHHVRAR